VTVGGTPGAGWYPDPWFNGQHRYWTGSQWTGDVFTDTPSVPASPRADYERPPAPPPTQRASTPPPAPSFGYAGNVAPQTSPTAVYGDPSSWDMLESGLPTVEREAWWRRLSRRQLNAIALVTGLVIGFVVVAAVVRPGHDSSAASPVTPLPAPTLPLAPSPQSSTPVSSDPDASYLQRLVVRQPDVVAGNSVQLLNAGNQVVGQTTLDLCNGTYPSEGLRSARLQVVEYDGTGLPVFSTEAVLYQSPKDAAQAMGELRSVAASCPNGPVTSPVGEPTVTTRFHAAPDKGWPSVAGVQRAAYSFTTTDQFGETDQRIAVYVQRGRVLEGLYFDMPTGTQPAVDGQTSVSGIVHLFEQRIAALPASVVTG
jgi:hypothetical protein